MTGKRFSHIDYGFVVDYESEQKLLNLYDVVDVLNAFNNENKTLKAQLYCEGSVCTICKHQQLTPDKVMQGYYTAKCEKGHKDCSKKDLKHCKDFEPKGDSDECFE